MNQASKQVLKLTKKDIEKYRLEIDEIDLSQKNVVLSKSILKISKLLENKRLDQYQLVLIQEINGLYTILKNNPNLDKLVQQKIIFALQYFLYGQDDIPDEIPVIGYLDDLAVVDWVIQDIKEQYSKYFKA